MSYSFKFYTDGVREYFQWEADMRLCATKRPVKKDFEFTQSLLGFLDIDFSNRSGYFNAMGKDIQRLRGKQDENGDVRFLRDCFDDLAKEHVYFQLLRLDWNDRLERYLARDYSDAYKLLPYKEITHIPAMMSLYQQQIRRLIEKALDGSAGRKKTSEQSMAALYENSRYDTHAVFEFQSIPTAFERVSKGCMTEVLYPKTTRDILDLTLREIVRRNVWFKVCQSCGKYFPSTVHGNTEFCDREFQNTGKTCREIGALTKWREKVAANPAILLYNRFYKTRFAWIRAKKISREAFQAWAAEARRLRDKVVAGEMGLDEYVDWLKR